MLTKQNSPNLLLSPSFSTAPELPYLLYFRSPGMISIEEFIRRKGKWSVVKVPTDPDFMPPCTHIILSSEDVEQEYFKFFDPELLNAMDEDGIVDQEVVIKLAEWLNTMNNQSQMLFIPWNYKRHWMLEIVCAGKIIHLDPLFGHKRPKMTIDLTL
ncbi:hypothetical protein G4B88_030353 [Cannabis sativa]|uniref:Ubiquitin-like protease family profile domain-containing protein n=1 Tax=Cannabis sativa TaxID=3483 RepID=A0A7J6DZ62_CANSA|nr:hypothetical protein G4B88_030353 [Cannabis sativa]